MRRSSGLLAAVLALGVQVRGHPAGVYFEHLSIEQGLSQSVVTCVCEDRQGFLWIGTQDGLNRYDGYHFRIFRNVPREPRALSDNHVRCLLVDRGNAVWVGTDGGGLNRLDPRREGFVHYGSRAGDDSSLSHDTVRCLAEDDSGALWIGTDGGLDRFDPKRNRFTRHRHRPGDGDSLSPGIIRAICPDADGRLWIGTDHGIDCYDPRSGRARHFRHQPADPDSLGSDHLLCLFRDRRGRLWAGTAGGGLNLLDQTGGRFVRVRHRGGAAGPGNDTVRAICDDPSGFIWAGTDDGLNQLDPQTGEIRVHRHDRDRAGSLSHNEIMALHADHNGILWVGTYTRGLNKFVRGKAIFTTHRFSFPPPASESQNHTWALLEDAEGSVWVGTSEGLNRLDVRSGAVTRFRHDPRNPATLSHDAVRTLCADPEGTLWVGTDGGLNRLDPGRGTCRRFVHDPSDPSSLANDEVMALLLGADGALWVATDGGGVDRLDRQRGTFRHFPAGDGPRGLSSGDAYCLCEDRDGMLWIGTSGGGLNRLDPRTGRVTVFLYDPADPASLSGNSIFSLHEDDGGTLWVGTRSAGLNRFDRSSGQFTLYTERDGLASNAVCGILSDERGRLWISTFNGLTMFDPVRRLFKNFDFRNGLQGNEFNQGAYYRSRSGELFFGGINGFNSFFPQQVVENRHIPPVVITAVRVLGRNQPLPESPDGEIVLRHNQNFLSFEFTALDFSIPEKNRYGYRLEGMDRDWVFTTAQKRFADYTNLAPGRYTFQVRGANPDGFWNLQGAHLRIAIVPPFWRTPWFSILAVLAFALASYFLISHAKKYLGLIRFWKRRNFISHYRILEQVASGGMGTIYKAVDVLGDLNTPVAVKVMKDELVRDSVQRKRFISEATIVDQLDLPHVVRIIERGEHNQNMFIAMEWLEGDTLAARLRRQGSLPVPVALDIMAQLAEVMFQIHARGIVHRDLKPENIILTDTAQRRDYVKLLDFGLARGQNVGRLTETGMVVGTITYMAPEQVARAEYSFASDVYAMGVIFYEALTGIKPFSGENTVDIMRQILDRAPPPASLHCPGLDPGLDRLISSMISKQVPLRPSIADVQAALRLAASRLAL